MPIYTEVSFTSSHNFTFSNFQKGSYVLSPCFLFFMFKFWLGFFEFLSFRRRFPVNYLIHLQTSPTSCWVFQSIFKFPVEPLILSDPSSSFSCKVFEVSDPASNDRLFIQTYCQAKNPKMTTSDELNDSICLATAPSQLGRKIGSPPKSDETNQ